MEGNGDEGLYSMNDSESFNSKTLLYSRQMNPKRTKLAMRQGRSLLHELERWFAYSLSSDCYP